MDKSFPLGFVAGSRVFCCDNLAFRSELMVKRKHTLRGEARFAEGIAQAVMSLTQFKEMEKARIQAMTNRDMVRLRGEEQALSVPCAYPPKKKGSAGHENLSCIARLPR